MKIQQLTERYINVLDPEEKRKYADAVWDILTKSYKDIGGYKGSPNVDDLIATTGLWKLVRRGGKIVALKIYKDQHGRKSVAAGTDGTHSGKKDLFKLFADDVERQRAWGEVSGAAEHLMKKYGGTPIPNKFAAMLTGKEVLDLDPDGYHYTRLIAGTPVRKIIIGYPEHPGLSEDRSNAQPAQNPMENPNFRRWFGNSKVVSKDGNPLVVHHGTTRDFTAFDSGPDAVNRKDDITGIFFTADGHAAYSYANQTARKVGGKKRIVSAYLRIENPLDITNAIKRYRKKGMTFGDAKREALKALDRNTHDGVIFWGNAYNPPEFIVFDPRQVKSVNNSGSYDPERPEFAEEIGDKIS